MTFYKWLRYKLWYYELAFFIKENKLNNGAEIGVKACRSFATFLRKNPRLHMVGMDLWEDQPDSPYANNSRNEIKSRQRCKRFGERAKLYKGDAALLADSFPDGAYDFVLYDCYNYRISTPEFHKRILTPWLQKLKPGGYLIGRDFHEPHIQEALLNLGYKDIRILKVKGRDSIRLKYVAI